MSQSSDIQNLFAEIGISGEGYRNLSQDLSQRESLARWPLLSSVHQAQEAAPAVQSASEVASVPKPTGEAQAALPERAKPSARFASMDARIDPVIEPAISPVIAPPVNAPVIAPGEASVATPVFASLQSLRTHSVAPTAPAAPSFAASAGGAAPAKAPLAQFIAPRPRGAAGVSAAPSVPVAPAVDRVATPVADRAATWPESAVQSRETDDASAASAVLPASGGSVSLKAVFDRLAGKAQPASAPGRTEQPAATSLLQRLNRL